jgi:hypothetical protein
MVHPGRHTGRLEGDFVVFLIGMRFNRPWKLHKWLPVFVAMPKMLRSLERQPEIGLLGWSNAWYHGPCIVQFWRSFEQLDRFARDPAEPHLPAWKRFNQAVRGSGDVGIWHETYKIRAGEYECVYGNMPRIGLAAAGEHLPVGSTGQQTAARRIGAAEDEPAVTPY